MAGQIQLNPEFKEFIQSQKSNDVRYLIIGGYAVALHGHPRYTKDIDIWIDLNEQNAVRVVQALEQFGFASLELKPEDFLEADSVVQLGYPPARIDLLVGLPDIAFDECYASRRTVLIDDVPVNFIDRDNLIKLKRAAGRPQDLADVDHLTPKD